jgi:predicted DNA binding CopG/RHH family protein
MSQESEFSFERARRVTPSENQEFRAAISDISEQFGIDLKKRDRSTKEEEEKYEPISIRFHPKILIWAKEEAKKRGIGYQTVINEVLLAQISRSMLTDRRNYNRY